MLGLQAFKGFDVCVVLFLFLLGFFFSLLPAFPHQQRRRNRIQATSSHFNCPEQEAQRPWFYSCFNNSLSIYPLPHPKPK